MVGKVEEKSVSVVTLVLVRVMRDVISGVVWVVLVDVDVVDSSQP